MWTRPCALRSNNSSTKPFFLFLPPAFFLFFTFCLFFAIFVPPVCAEEMIVSPITLNAQEKGEFFIIMRDDGDFLVSPSDLEQIGLRDLPPERVVVNDEDYISLRKFPEVTFSFDDQNLILRIMAQPSLFPVSQVSLSNIRQTKVYYPKESSFFINYSIDHTSGGESSLEFQGLNLSNEVGLRLGDSLFLSDTIYTETQDDRHLVRLDTRMVWDQREKLRRNVVGDFSAVSGGLGSLVKIGGLSFSKIYRIDPYFIRYPMFNFSGSLDLPSEVELYADGVKIRTEDFSPGEFELLNFQGFRGAQDIEVVIRDSFGREKVLDTSIYFTDQVLSQGLHEYSYNIGFLRDNFGISSNDYGNSPVFSAFHRYGLANWINVGGRTELSEDLINLGFETILVAHNYGLFKLDISASNNRNLSGTAGQLIYEYQTRRFNARLGLQAYSTDYRTLGDLDGPTDRKLNLLASTSYLTADLGSFGLNYTEAKYHEQTERRQLSFSWSRRLIKQAYLTTSLAWIDEEVSRIEGSAILSWRFGQDYNSSASYRHENDNEVQRLELYKITPSGYGTGWNLAAENIETDTTTENRAYASLQHNAQRAILRANIGQEFTESINNTSARFQLSGALVYVGGQFGLTRPVRDSFSLIRVGEAEDVRVYVNNQVSGRTDRHGRVFVPELTSYYDNRISFEDKDLPLGVLMPQVGLYASPPLRSGSCINFPIRPYQAFTGTLLSNEDDKILPLTNAELALQTPSGPLKFWTGGDGEFYIDSQIDEIDILSVQGCAAIQDGSTSFLPAGTYPIKVKQESRTFETEISIPESDEIYTELGTVTLPVLSGTAPEVDSVPSPEKDDKTTGPERPVQEAVQALEPEPTPAAKAVPAEQPQEQKSASATPIVELARQTPQTGQTDMQQHPSFTIHFPLDSSIPLPADQSILDQALNYLLEHPERPIDIEGHADQQGSAAYNQKLGYWRAQALRDYLVNAGINPRRFSRIVSYGESKPLCRDTSEDCLRQNRRAIVLVAITPES